MLPGAPPATVWTNSGFATVVPLVKLMFGPPMPKLRTTAVGKETSETVRTETLRTCDRAHRSLRGAQ